MPTIDDFKTTIVNTSGAERWFSFLGPYGLTLANGASYTAVGTVNDWLQSRRTRPDNLARLQNDLKAALEGGKAVIKSSPKTVIYDVSDDRSVILNVDNSIATIKSPSFAATPMTPVDVGP